MVAATVAPAEELSPGARWDRYVVLHVLGAGGMGVVYEAWDPELERRVALKVLRPGSPMERAQREAQALARITHPNVVSVHDVGVVAGQVFVVMELVAGEPLGGWARGRASGEVLDVLVQAGRGLAAAHAVGVVHRDVKPDNILVTRGGRAVVTDLGLARAPTAAPHPQAAVGSLTVTGTLLGTPAYMAPEQARGERVDA
ncbi:MAG TPA: serine/threonine-protein kinase, partial [Myxococcota bacterium]|nr:serine/threonine-protein kinase [Myxococcota bacterium]